MARKDTWTLPLSEDKKPQICALCSRPLGQKTEMHHLVPKSQGGKETIPLHPICHRKIHTTFKEKTLARNFATIDCLRNDPEIMRFIKWLEGKPSDFFKRTGKTNKR